MLENDENVKEAVLVGVVMAALTLVIIFAFSTVTPELYNDSPVVLVIISLVVSYLISNLIFRQKV